MEQPAIVKPSTSGKPGKQEKEKKKVKSKASKIVENDSSDASESCEHLDEDFIVAQEIQSMIEIIEIVHQMASCVEASEKEGSYSAVAELNAQVAAVIDMMITIIAENAPSMSFYSNNRPLSSGLSVSLVLESILQSVENGGTVAVQKPARIRLEGPIIDLRSLPWELKAAAEISSATTLPSESRLSQLWSESPANLRNDLREGRMNWASGASTQHTNAVQNALSVVPPLNLEIAQTLRRKHDQRF